MQKISHSLFVLYLSLLLFLNSALALYEGPEINEENDTNPISELYHETNPAITGEVIANMSYILKNYIFLEILQNPPFPYSDYKVNLIDELQKIDTTQRRPFYEFYRDVKKALSLSHDANLDFLGGKLRFLPENQSFSDYRMCLPFKFYMDYENYDNYTEVKLFIKEYPICSGYYNESVVDFIRGHENISVESINGGDPFSYIQDFGNEFYKFKNPDSDFSIIIDSIHDNYLAFTPVLPEFLNHIELYFSSNETLDTHYHIIKTPNETKKENNKINKEQINSDIPWEYHSENGEVKCRVDKVNQLNVLFFNSFIIDKPDNATIFDCAKLFYSNDYKIVIITSQLWESDNIIPFYYLQALFPKMDGKFNMAMKQTNFHKNLFEKDRSKFLDAKTCRPFETWEDFIEENPDDYGDNITHSRTKIFNPIQEQDHIGLYQFRKELIKLGHLKKSTEILIITDTVNYGPASIFMKTIQNNGGAIVASYSGNPTIDKSTIETLDASSDPSFTTIYKGEYSRESALDSIPYAEAFEYLEEGNETLIPMAFKVNKVDEFTNIYHFYDDAYYDEFIAEANKIFEKYNDNGECNAENTNLVLENYFCTFPDDKVAHGGYKCGSNGKWTNQCQKSFCDFPYFYDKSIDKCEIDRCYTDEIIEINEETEIVKEIDPTKRYIINLNTNEYTYLFQSPVDYSIYYSNFEECPRFCMVKENNDYMILNYERKLKSPVNITITSKKVNLQVQSVKISSPKQAKILPMAGNMIFVFQLKEDNYMYVDSFDKSSLFYFAEYKDDITPNDIINLNKNKFKEGLDQFMYLPKGGIYIGIFKQQLSFAKIYFFDSLPEKILIKSVGENTIFYLKNGQNYQLNFSNNYLPVAIRLNEKFNGSCDISDYSNYTKNISLLDKYFIPSEQPYEGILKISNITSESEGVLIEILYSLGDNNTEIINEPVTDYVISNQSVLIEYNPPEENKKVIQIYVESNEKFDIYTYGGPSIEQYFYYSFIPYHVSNYAIKLDDPLKDLELEYGEKYYISVMTYPQKDNQEIRITVKYENNPIEDLYEIIDESYANDVISNLTSLINYAYIYNDIAKNPPEPNGLENYTHPPIDFAKAFSEINITNRSFYDFYRDIRAILGTPRDLHFGIFGLNTSSGKKFGYMTACLPFSFYVEKNENETEPKMYIKYFQDCGVYFSEKVRQYVKEKADNKIPLELINDENPFEYIQKWGRIYRGNKSPHAHFTFMKTLIHTFYLYSYPYKPEELKMQFKFEGENDTCNLDYYIFLPNFREMNKLLGANILSEEEFDDFYQKEMKKNIKNVIAPNIFEMIKKYKKSKGIILEEEENNTIQWDYETPEKDAIKCRVDNVKHLNVIYQKTFMLDMNHAKDTLVKCFTAFYNNNYKIVVIEDLNSGGDGRLGIALAQMLQIKKSIRAYLSWKPLEVFREIFKESPESFIDVDTCKPYPDFDDFLNGTVDVYPSESGEIYHHRTNVRDIDGLEERKMLNDFRKKFLNDSDPENIKKPTDIIVFTDSFSYSTTCIFIKALQNHGGAIIVGYNGNPFLEKEVFDASQSPAPVLDFSFTKEYENLKKLGIYVGGITFGETFDEDYKLGNPIPREYKLDPIDERVEIYDAYSDDKYDTFMAEALRVFKMYNEEGKCNPNNTDLLFEPESGCGDFDNDTHAHGGYQCNSEGMWDNSTCKKSYCDYGYYYSKIENKCLPDKCAYDPDVLEITLNGEYDETIVINGENNYEYIFTIETGEYTYFFEPSESGYLHYAVNNPCPSYLCVLQKGSANHKNKLHLNYFRNGTDNNVTIKITSVKGYSGMIQSFIASEVDMLQVFPNLVILITEEMVDYVFYFKTFDSESKKLCAEYNEEMTLNDIIYLNESYFSEFGDQVIEAQAGKKYIFAYQSNTNGKLFKLLIQPKIGDKDLVVSDGTAPLQTYFSRDIVYTLDFSKNKYDRILQLSKSTINSEVIITNLATGNQTTLNVNNSYYPFDNINSIFTGKLSLQVVSGENAILETLFVPTEKIEVINDKEFSNRRIRSIAIIPFEQNTKNININITLASKTGTPFAFSFLTYYSNSEYSPLPEPLQPSISGSNSYLLTINNKDEVYEEGESLYLILYVDNKALANDEILITKVEDKEHGEDEEEGKEEEKEQEKEQEIEQEKEQEKEQEEEKEKEKEKEQEEEKEKEQEKEQEEEEKGEDKDEEEEGKGKGEEEEEKGKEEENEEEEKKKGSDQPTDEKEDGGLEGWAIALIVLGSVIIVAIIIIIIWKFVISKDQVNSEIIGSLVDNNAQSNVKELNEQNRPNP